MTNFRVNVKTNFKYSGAAPRLYERVRKFDAEANDSTSVVSEAMANRVADETRSTLENAPGGGILWPPYKRSSALPGDPPVVQSGELVGSIETVVISNRSANVVVNADYGYFHETGDWTSRSGKKQAARPFLRPSLYAVKHELRQIAAEILGEILW